MAPFPALRLMLCSAAPLAFPTPGQLTAPNSMAVGCCGHGFSAGYCSPGSGFTEVLLDMTPLGEQRGAETFGHVWRKQDSSWFLGTGQYTLKSHQLSESRFIALELRSRRSISHQQAEEEALWDSSALPAPLPVKGPFVCLREEPKSPALYVVLKGPHVPVILAEALFWKSPYPQKLQPPQQPLQCQTIEANFLFKVVCKCKCKCKKKSKVTTGSSGVWPAYDPF